MSVEVTACERCEWRYPDELLSMFVSGLGRRLVCGLCALEMRNAIIGMREARFHGEMAEHLRQRAAGWRAHHPECRPEAE